MKYLRVILIVLLLGCCTLWVASYWTITWKSQDGLTLLQLSVGSFTVGRFKIDLDKAYGRPTTYGLAFSGSAHLPTRWWPVAWVYTDPNWWWLYGTFWLPTLLLALPLAISASPWSRRRRRAKQGLCIRCGYDLGGTEHKTCPECGSVVDSQEDDQ